MARDMNFVQQHATTMPLAVLKNLVNHLPINNRQDLASRLERKVLDLLRKAAYVQARASGCGDSGHANAVKAQNGVIAKVRAALGYTVHKDDITF